MTRYECNVSERLDVAGLPLDWNSLVRNRTKGCDADPVMGNIGIWLGLYFPSPPIVPRASLAVVRTDGLPHLLC